MVLSATTTHCVLIEHAQSGSGLARVEDSGVGPGNGFNELARQRGNPTQALHEIQNHAFAGKNDACIVPDDSNRLSLVQPDAIEDFCMGRNLVMGSHRAIQGGIHVQNAGDAADARENAVLLGENRSRGTLVRINAGIAGGVARRAILQQRVLDNRGDASAIPVHRSCGDGRLARLAYFSSSSLLFTFSRRTSSSCARFRIPSTTFAGAFARNCSLPNWRCPFAISFSICSSSFFNRSRSAAKSIFLS